MSKKVNDKWGLDREKNLPCAIVKSVNSDEGIFPPPTH